MTSDRPRRLAAAALALTATFALGACGTGLDAQTNQQYQPAIGANVRTAEIEVHNALLVLNEDGTFSFSGGVVNETDLEQTLESLSIVPLAPSAGGAQPTEVQPSTDVTIDPQSLLTVGTTGELAGLEVPGLDEGRYATLTFTFSDAAEVTVEVPVVARDASYADVATTPAESEDETAQRQAEADEAAAEEGADASAEGTND